MNIILLWLYERYIHSNKELRNYLNTVEKTGNIHLMYN